MTGDDEPTQHARPVNYVAGDQFNQSGNRNIGKIINHGESDGAAKELQTLIRRLEAEGVLTANGGINDDRRMKEIVREDRPRLTSLLQALRGGAGPVVARSVEHAASRVVVALVDAWLT